MMALLPETREAMMDAIPHLRAFAISLTGNVDQADDLVQETLARGLANIDRFAPGTSMRAWLFTILRNQFHTAYRKRRREVEDPDGIMAARLSTAPAQGGHLDLEDLKTALAKLPYEQREALLLVAAEGSVTKKPPRSAAWRSARSRVGSTVLAIGWRNSLG